MRTPEEKVNELIEKFWLVNPKFILGGGEDDYSEAIKCSIICVDNIIDALTISTGHLTINSVDEHELVKDFDYWKEVKIILENKLK